MQPSVAISVEWGISLRSLRDMGSIDWATYVADYNAKT